jgi:hypothetical protein
MSSAPMHSKGPFWPDGARPAVSISMQFEAGAQPERGAESPFPPLDTKYPDLPVQTWFDYGIKEGIPRLLDIDDPSRDEPFLVQVNGKPFVVVPYTVEHNDIVLFESRHFSAQAFGQELKDAFDVLYEEAATRRRLLSVSAHDRISGHPARVKAFAEFIDYAQKQKGVWFARKDEIARWTLERANTLHEK